MSKLVLFIDENPVKGFSVFRKKKRIQGNVIHFLISLYVYDIDRLFHDFHHYGLQEAY